MSFLLKLKGYAIAALAAIAAILGALVLGEWRGRKDGAASATVGAAQATINAVKSRNEIEAKIAKQPEGAATKALKDKWSRDAQ